MSIRLSSPSNKRRTLTSTPLRSISRHVRRLFVHICEFCGLICGDAGVDDLLDIAVHDLV